ncbi:MAG TPA: glutamate 5-kinase [Ruminiclostridium sp.]|jgi:glutamate 5-kinase|uniref:Glutamate 5-kinase n=1 Tax=Acetivibrio saccincola TaxID=1677857 RepID=A0A2S8RA65_9FIRM|nr:glutamate 5-kinase [Acetivibrio saccincola]HAA43266.1 glutamate 5-kinase [Ruminiclostridium sp.]NLW27611.1 glutamate 5-kinase [Acetivibrio saccincola]PQQ66679.1 glutamate 5-kinase [Acetivibrio saccincola]HOA96408.1 glutamate 5-kinase [Acetivibrio saccincola]HQD28151.1 glutamate 5-kinase [Acetivibrio saccincola]
MEGCSFRRELVDAKRIVVKVGTSTLTYENGKINFSKIDKLSRVLSDLMNQGKELVLVTSGAVGIGMSKLKLKSKPQTTREKQAVAAVGQCELMHVYGKFFSEYGHLVGQILLTKDVTTNEISRQNVINTLETLIEKDILPIVNENDSVAVDELENGINRVFGDNDTLSAIVAELVKADLLIILSDIDGLYTCDPRKNSCSELISVVEEITPEIEGCAGGVGSRRGTGGMITKITAAKMAVSNGINLVIANGEEPSIISDILEGKNVGTLFVRKKQA